MLPPIILASQSPRRKEILQMANIPFEAIVHKTDETYPQDLSIHKIPQYIAYQKGISVHHQYPNKIIIAADTIVYHKQQIIGKPTSTAHAKTILQSLSNSVHEVITGVVIFYEKKVIQFSEKTKVHFAPLTAAQIDYYIETHKPMDKAGAYAIQEWIGLIGIKKITGCYYNVMGLPIHKLLRYLHQLK